MYYFIYVVYLRFAVVWMDYCVDWCVIYVLGRVVVVGLSKDVGIVVCTILMYVVICCMFTTSLRCEFISLCGDAFNV